MSIVTILQPNADYRSLGCSGELINKKILVVAERGTGKSILVCKLYENMSRINKFNKVFIVSCTEQFDPYYENKIPEFELRSSLTTSVSDELAQIESGTLVVLDDCISSMRWRRHKHTLKLLTKN